MAVRNMLPASQIEDFKAWLVKDGWTLEKPKGFYEVIRARKAGRNRPLIVWERAANRNGTPLTHLTVEDRDFGVIAAFMKEA